MALTVPRYAGHATVRYFITTGETIADFSGIKPAAGNFICRQHAASVSKRRGEVSGKLRNFAIGWSGFKLISVGTYNKPVPAGSVFYTADICAGDFRAAVFSAGYSSIFSGMPYISFERMCASAVSSRCPCTGSYL